MNNFCWTIATVLLSFSFAQLRKKNINRFNTIISCAQKSAKTDVFLREGRVFVPAMDSLCGGLSLKIGKLYLIAGNSQNINICSFVKEYSQMTIVERRGFAGAYKKGCSCDVCTLLFISSYWSYFS